LVAAVLRCGNRWELPIPKPFLKSGAFHLQQVQPIPIARLDTKIGELTSEEFQQVKRTLARLLDL
jgi:mRNA-degrading endonuclease toxin of MazEF toxin-antitoxin module